MHKLGRAAIVFTFTLASGIMAQENPPAQSPSEAEIGRQFQQAAPQLFQEWVDRQLEWRKSQLLGHRNKPLGSFCPAVTHFEFMECTGPEPGKLQPTKIDVTRTNSLITPFVGHIYVPVLETCKVRNVVGPKGTHWGKKGYEEAMLKLEPACVGKFYAECIAAGGRDAPKIMGSACVGGPVRDVPMEDVHLAYGWTQGKWEFQDEGGNGTNPASAQEPKRGGQDE